MKIISQISITLIALLACSCTDNPMSTLHQTRTPDIDSASNPGGITLTLEITDLEDEEEIEIRND